MAHASVDSPSPWVVRWAPLAERGPVLDVASGAGRHCRVFLQKKLPVVAVDGTPVGDGILTAYEVTGMDLEGTELVNLTACETGVGAVTPDGVAGLRQAFLWAGARSLTMSMWEVPVTEVTAQIETFYSRWLDVPAGQAGPSRYEAFRASQVAALTTFGGRPRTGRPRVSTSPVCRASVAPSSTTRTT